MLTAPIVLRWLPLDRRGIGHHWKAPQGIPWGDCSCWQWVSLVLCPLLSQGLCLPAWQRKDRIWQQRLLPSPPPPRPDHPLPHPVLPTQPPKSCTSEWWWYLPRLALQHPWSSTTGLGPKDWINVSNLLSPMDKSKVKFRNICNSLN